MSNQQNDIYEENKREFLEEEIMENTNSLEEKERYEEEELCEICGEPLSSTQNNWHNHED